jgi:hypothetical protein
MSNQSKTISVSVSVPSGTVLSIETVNGSLELYKTSSTYSKSVEFDTRPGTKVTAAMFDDILEAMKDILDHNHTYIDAYSANCNCNCNCNCQCSRGTL